MRSPSHPSLLSQGASPRSHLGGPGQRGMWTPDATCLGTGQARHLGRAESNENPGAASQMCPSRFCDNGGRERRIQCLPAGPAAARPSWAGAAHVLDDSSSQSPSWLLSRGSYQLPVRGKGQIKSVHLPWDTPGSLFGGDFVQREETED